MITGQKIFLVGMPGSGKSTLGKVLANILSITFFDLDDEIEKQERKTISEIFNLHGEEHFRELENKKLTELAYVSMPLLLATGGGTPCFHDNMKLMNGLGMTIYIDAPINEIAARLTSTKLEIRPLFSGLSKEELVVTLSNLYTERLPYYKQARHVFSSETSVKQIVKAL